MDIAKIIYVSLTMLTAWVFMSIAFPIDTCKHLLGVVGSYICVKLFGAVCKLVCMALGTPFFLCKVFIVWLAYCIFVSCRLNYWLQYSNYLLSCCGVHVISTEPITLWEVLSYLLAFSLCLSILWEFLLLDNAC